MHKASISRLHACSPLEVIRLNGVIIDSTSNHVGSCISVQSHDLKIGRFSHVAASRLTVAAAWK